jgi:gluconolactonase
MAANDGLYEVFDKRFKSLMIGIAHLDKLADGCIWAEGPVWFADGGYLLWSDIPNNRMLRWTPETGVSIFRAESNNSNGNTRDRQGRLVTCEHLTRRVTRTEPDGSITVISYGIMTEFEGSRSEQEQGGCYVYRVDPKGGEIATVVEDFVKPNGLAFSPDEKILYVADSAASHDPNAPHHIRAFDVVDGRKLANGRVFCDIKGGSIPDGFRVDVNGNVWTSADGVECYAPDGTLLGRIKVPEVVANVTFGGKRRNRLFITATTSLYAVYVNTTGVQRP